LEGIRRRLHRLFAPAACCCSRPPDKGVASRLWRRAGVSTAAKPRTKLTYKETRELEALPGEIEALEAEHRALADKMAGADYYRQPPDALREDQRRHAEIDRLLLEKLERWEELEARGR
jgi:hypothetical protein